MSDQDQDPGEIDRPHAIEGIYNAADPKQVKKRAKDKKQDQRELEDVWNALLSNANGRRWLAWVLFDVCRLQHTTVNVVYDPNALHYREGQAEVGRALRREALRVNREKFIEVLKEHLPQT